MNKRNWIIMLGSILIFLTILTIFVFKARGSNERDTVSGCIPYNVSVTRVGDYKAIIEWSTVEECLGYIGYGNDRNKLDFIAVNNENLSSKVHSISVDKLLPNQTYFFVVNSGDESYGNKGVPLSFSLSSL